MKNRRGELGMTLIELLIGMTVLAVLAGVEILLLNTGLEAWAYSNSRVELQRASNQLMEILLEGGYEGEGIRDGVELSQAGPSSIGFVPLWTDRTHTPDPVRNKAQKFILERQFKPSGPTPIGQVRPAETLDFLGVPVKLRYGSSRDPRALDDEIQFTEPIPPQAEVRVMYTPDSENDTSVIKFFRWDKEQKKIYETYAGKTRDLLAQEPSVAVERCAFLYYDNLNRLIPSGGEDEPLSTLNLRRVTAVKLYLLLSRGEERRELTSFTNVRNVATIGATVTEGAQLPMPAPAAIRAFSIGDLYGLKRGGVVELLVTGQGNKEWLVRLQFKAAEREDDLILERFQIESPRKKIVTSAILEQTISASEFISLLTIDRSGLYDYDDDKDLRDLIEFPEGPNTLTVVRLDFEGASIFVRP